MSILKKSITLEQPLLLPSNNGTLSSSSSSSSATTQSQQMRITYSFLHTSNFNNFNSNAITNKDKLEQIRLKITDKHMILQKDQTDGFLNLSKELNLNSLTNDNNSNTNNFQHLQFANTIITHENNEETRTVKLKRHSIYGLGLCVKGGKEHGLPLLISNMFKNQPAEQCGQLKVGDAILKVNTIDITQLTHEQAVNVLKSTSAPSTNWNGLMPKRNSTNLDSKPLDYDVILVVKNYSSVLEKFRVSATQSLQNITQQLTDLKTNSLNNSPTHAHESEPGWIDLISIPLELAYVTQYIPGTDKLRDLAFEVYSKTGISSGILVCDSLQKKNELIMKINHNIQLCISSHILFYNATLLPSNQITYMCWINERIHSEQNWSCWNRVLLVIKSDECFFYDNCDLPSNKGDFSKCKKVYKVYESLFKLIKLHEQLDDRNYCFVLHNCDGTAHYMNVESSEHLTQLEKHWQRTLYTSIYSLGSKSFTCIYENKVCMLYIDIHKGFILMDNDRNETLWSYQFSQLKTSSDDNVSKVKFFFQDPLIKRIEVKHLECNELYCLLYVIHSFLTAKLTSANINSIK